jgi:hypothetical protein
MVGLNRLMGSQPSFYNGCISNSYIHTFRPLFANRSYLLNRIALYICGVSIVRLYRSDFLLDIYFRGFMNRKNNNILLFCFILFYFVLNVL